jgi:peptidyl-tRNA hydrolase, PTH1 family
MKIIVGLGNPGPRYAGTRHNVGFDVVDWLAAGGGTGPFRSRFQAQVAEFTDGAETVLLVKPETFMNLSGQCVRAALDFYKRPVEDLLVVCDDMALPLGKLRMRESGTHGGHNGLRNIQEHLGTAAYCRLRIGVGEPDDDAVEHVLSRFRTGERDAMSAAVQLAGEAVLVWVRQGPAECMNRYNGPPEKKKVSDASKKRAKKNETEDPNASADVRMPDDA